MHLSEAPHADLVWSIYDRHEVPYEAANVLEAVARGQYGAGTVQTLLDELAEQRRNVYVVAVYECHQAFGGHEEGGWWYDTGHLARIVRTFRGSEYAANRYCRRLNERLDSRRIGPNQGRREYTSVLSEGEYRARVYTTTAPENFPDSRPHYE